METNSGAKVPIREEAWDRFWDIFALAVVEADLRGVPYSDNTDLVESVPLASGADLVVVDDAA